MRLRWRASLGCPQSLQMLNLMILQLSLTALPDLRGLSALTSLQTLNLDYCGSLTALPDLSALTSLQTLNLDDACDSPHGAARPVGAHVAADAQPRTLLQSLTALPDLSALTSLQTLNLERCKSLTALPDLSALTSLQTLSLYDCTPSRRCPTSRRSQTSRCQDLLTSLKMLTPWLAGGFKAWDFITDGWPLDSTEINLKEYGGATLPDLSGVAVAVHLVQTLDLEKCKSLTALPDLSALTSLQTLDLYNC